MNSNRTRDNLTPDYAYAIRFTVTAEEARHLWTPTGKPATNAKARPLWEQIEPAAARFRAMIDEAPAKAAQTEEARARREADHRAEVEQIRAAEAEARGHREQLTLTNEATGEEITTAADIATSIAIRAMYNKSGLPLYREMQWAWSADRTARAAAEIESRRKDHATKAETAREERDKTRAAARRYTKAAAKLLELIPAEAEALTAAAQIMEDMSKEEADTATREATAAQDEEKGILNQTLSQNRPDLVQAAALAFYELTTAEDGSRTRPTPTAEDIAAAGLDPDHATEADREQLTQAVIFRAMINAARRESSKLAHPDSMTGTSTKRKPATAADVRAWIETIGGTGAEYKRGANRKNTKATDCFQTMEARKDGAGFDLVTHYKTVNLYDSIEAIEAERGTPLVDPTAGAFATVQKAGEHLHRIFTAADLTEQERKAVRAYCDTKGTAAAMDDLAAEAYRIKRFDKLQTMTPAARARAAERIEDTARAQGNRARWAEALTMAGYSNTRARERAHNAIISAMMEATRKPAAADIIREAPKPRPDLIAAVSRPQTPRTDTMHPVTYCDPDTGRVLTAYTETAEAAARAIHEAHQSQSKTPTGKPDHSNPTKAKTPEEAARAAKAYRERKPNPGTVFIVECADPKTAKATGRICTHA